MSDKSSIINEAQRYLARGQIDKAIAELEKLLKEYPDGNSYNTVGDLYLKKGDKKNAVDLFHKAANLFLHEGFSLKALAIYKKILNVNPTDPDALFSIGELSEEKGLTIDAMKYYLAASESFSKEGKKEKLIKVYDKVFSISPTNIPLRNKIAEIYAKEGLTSEAVKQYFQIAMLYAEEGDIEKSIGYYQKVLNFQHLNREAILGINFLYERTGNLERALEQMKEATTQFPQDIDIHLRYAELNIMMGRLNEAREGLMKVIELDSANTRARRLLGDIYVKEGDKEKAWTEYLPVLDKMILEEKYDDAVKLLDSFKDVKPLETRKRLISLYRQIGDQVQTANELISLGDMLIEMGVQKEALDCYKEALKITPDSEPLKAKVAELETELSIAAPHREPALAEGKISEVEKIHEPALEGEVLEVFSEFKKGLEKEIKAEDYETHYNLGIAYNEMELIDDAIREFQISLKEPKRFIHSSNMLGICYMKKGLYSPAIDVLKNAIEKIGDRDESYWAMKYDLAEAYEKNGNTKEALDLYTEIYEWNSKFRNVSDKITHLREVCGIEQKKPKGRKDRVSYI
ncbi:MAG: tetratricopeptide repeat protein [Nitrospirota bacterium]